MALRRSEINCNSGTPFYRDALGLVVELSCESWPWNVFGELDKTQNTGRVLGRVLSTWGRNGWETEEIKGTVEGAKQQYNNNNNNNNNNYVYIPPISDRDRAAKLPLSLPDNLNG
eukprot:sb/3476799/